MDEDHRLPVRFTTTGGPKHRWSGELIHEKRTSRTAVWGGQCATSVTSGRSFLKACSMLIQSLEKSTWNTTAGSTRHLPGRKHGDGPRNANESNVSRRRRSCGRRNLQALGDISQTVLRSVGEETQTEQGDRIRCFAW